MEVVNQGYFNEFAVRLPRPAAAVVDALAEKRVLAGVPVSRLYPEQPDLADLLLVAATELTSESDIRSLTDALSETLR